MLPARFRRASCRRSANLKGGLRMSESKRRSRGGVWRLWCAAWVLSLVCAAAAYAPPSSSRAKTTLNARWKYFAGNPAGTPQAVGYDDAGWDDVHLPHCFKIPWWVNEHINFGGVGWYRRHFTLDGPGGSNRVSVEFEGVFLHCWVYVNGTLVGEHKGGFTSFIFDITDEVSFGGSDNVLAVKVSAEFEETIAPRAGDFIFMGGIYRDVYLVETAPLHVAWYGTFVTTPFGGDFLSGAGYTLPSSFAEAPVRVETEVENRGGEARDCVVKNFVVDADGRAVDSMSGTLTVGAGSTETIDQSCTIGNPHFWSLSDPYLYRVFTEIHEGAKVVDVYESPLGIRWLQFTGQQGFWINGEQTYLHGVNAHQDHAGWATAITNAGHYRDVRLCKEAGVRLIRGSHYPKDPAFVQACDEIGVCLILEMCYWGKGGGSGAAASPPAGSPYFSEFVDNAKAQMREMIRTFRNDPSVIIWSVANEPTGGEMSCDVLNAVAKEEDPTRPTMRVGNFSTGGQEDIAGQNGGAPACWSKPTVFTELWESAELSRPGTYSGGADAEKACNVGTARWAAFDYGTHENWTLNMVGMCDSYRIPKRRFYWYRNRWLGEAPPAWPSSGTAAKLRLSADKTTILSDGTDDCQVLVTVCNSSDTHVSNSVSATLSVESGTGMFPTGSEITLNTPDGLAGIEFRSYEAGTVVLKAASAGLPEAVLELEVKDPAPALRVRPAPLTLCASQGPRMHARASGNRFTIVYDLGRAGQTHEQATLGLYALDGRRIVSIDLAAARGQVQFDKRIIGNAPVASGAFVFVLSAGRYSVAQKCLAAK